MFVRNILFDRFLFSVAGLLAAPKLCLRILWDGRDGTEVRVGQPGLRLTLAAAAQIHKEPGRNLDPNLPEAAPADQGDGTRRSSRVAARYVTGSWGLSDRVPNRLRLLCADPWANDDASNFLGIELAPGV